MPRISEKTERLYWSIGEVATAINSSPSAVRFWLSSFDNVEVPKRATNGKRLFNKYDYMNILVINYLVNVEEYTISGARKKFKLWIEEKYEIPEEYLIIPNAQQRQQRQSPQEQ